MFTTRTTRATLPSGGSPGALLGTQLTSDQQSQIKTNVQNSQTAGVPALTAGLQANAPILTLTELFILPYVNHDGLMIYKAAAEAAIGDINASHYLNDLQTFAKVSASNTGIVFDCTTSESFYFPVNICYDPKTGMPRTQEELFPTLTVELGARGQPLQISLAPTIIEGFSGRSTYRSSYTQGSSSGSSVFNTKYIVVAVIIVLILLFVAYRHVRTNSDLPASP
jgi:hypothetical protein